MKQRSVDANQPPIPVIRDLIFAQDVLQKMSFSSADIYVGLVVAVGVGPATAVILNTQGKQWIWTLDRCPMGSEEFDRHWDEAVAAWAVAPWTKDRWGYCDSPIFKSIGSVAGSLAEKGIVPPKMIEFGLQPNKSVSFACPFCDAMVHAGDDAQGRSMVLHVVPTCKVFDDLEPDEYLAKVNRNRRESLARSN